MRLHVSFLLAAGIAACSASAHPLCAQSIRRLDGSSLLAADADVFARQTLSAAEVTGAQLAILNDGKLTWNLTYGLRGKQPDLAMGSETVTWAASITKSLFATWVMQLVEAGQLDLDRPVAQLLPHPLDTYEPYRYSASALVHDPAWATVTARMLLAHTSGLANFAALEPDRKMHLRSRPGTQYLYSGEGYNLLQFVLEQKLGKPLETLIGDALLDPTGMTHTSLVFRKPDAVDIADRFDAQGRFLAQTRRAPARAAGSATTNALDLARFVTTLFAGRILDTPTLTQMLTPQVEIRSLHQFPLAPNEQPGAETASSALAYGLGWGLLPHTRYGPAFFKEGHGDGGQNYMICFTRSHDCMILLTNSDNGELAFRPLLETLLGDTVTPWEWEGYTPAYLRASRLHP